MNYEYMTIRRQIDGDTAFIALGHELQRLAHEGWRVHTQQIIQMGTMGALFAYVLLERAMI